MNVKIPAGLSKAAAKCMASLQKASPEIALVSGLVGIVGTTVLACKKTRKLDDILEKHDEIISKIGKNFTIKVIKTSK